MKMKFLSGVMELMLLDKPKKVELIKYLPLFMQKYKELEVIFNSEDKIIQEVLENLKQAFKNNFIFLTNEKGISLFENMIGITPDDSLNLTKRQSLVFFKWNSTIPYTFKWLLSFLTNYYLYTDTATNAILRNNIYELEIEIIKNGDLNQFDFDLYFYLRKVVPANLDFNISKKITSNCDYYLNNLETQIIIEEYK